MNTVASALAELLLSPADPTYPIYHIENPTRQSWPSMVRTLSTILSISRENIISFPEWIKRVRQFTGNETDNPAKKLVGFLEGHFLRMSCGDLVLGTEISIRRSESLRGEGEISPELVRKYVEAWKEMGFLK